MIGSLLLVSALELGVGLAAGADIATTHVARQHGLYELNPVMPEPALSFAIKAGTTAVVIETSRYLERRGRRHAAKAVAISAIVVWGGAAIWNLRQIKEMGR